MENPINAPVDYTEFQLSVYENVFYPILTNLYDKMNSYSRFRVNGMECKDVPPLHKSDRGRMLFLIADILDFAEDQFGLYVIDGVAMHEIDRNASIEEYYLARAEDMARLMMADDGCAEFSYQDLPVLTEENCKYFPYLSE